MDQYLRYMNTSELFDTVTELYKKTFGMQLIYNIVTGILYFAVFMAGSFLLSPVVYLLPTTFVLISSFVIQAFIGALFKVGNMFIARQKWLNEKMDMGFALQETIKCIPHVFSVVILEAIAFIPLGVIWYKWVDFIGSELYYFNFYYGNFTVVFATILISFLLLAAVTIFFYILFYMAVPVAAFEKKIFFSAIIKNFKLLSQVGKMFFSIMLWYFSFVVIGVSIFMLTVTLVSIFYIQTSYYHYSDFMVFILTLVYLLIYVVAKTGVFHINAILRFTVYSNQKILKDGLDINFELTNKMNQQIKGDKNDLSNI